MRQIFAPILVIALVSTPTHAASWHDQAAGLQPGAFIGARIQMPLGGDSGAKPRAALTLAPTQSRISNAGMVRTTIREGAALSFAPGAKPAVTLAGIRADKALAFQSAEKVKADSKLGISTGAAIAIGVGVAALAVGLLVFKDAVEDASE